MSKRTRTKKHLADYEDLGSDDFEALLRDQDTAAAAAQPPAAAGGRSKRTRPPRGSYAAMVAAEGSSEEDKDEEGQGSSSDEGLAHKRVAGRKKKQAAGKGLRIGARKAMDLYDLDYEDLSFMKDVTEKSNFLFGWGDTQSMYSPRELEEYARKKHAGKEGFEESMQAKLQKQEARRQKRQQKRAPVMAAAAQAITQYGTRSSALAVEQYGDTKLPDSVLVRVMECLADTREPGGLRGFACVSKDLANASLISWDFYRAAKAGFAALGAAASIPANHPYVGSAYYGRGYTGSYGHCMHKGSLQSLPGPDSLGGWQFWEAFLLDPTSTFTVPKVKEAARALGIKPKGTKAEMALSVLEAFGLKAATTAPVRLLQVVGLERSPRLAWDGPDGRGLYNRTYSAIDKLVTADRAAWQDLADAAQSGVAGIRAAIRERFNSIEEFVQAAEAADQERKHNAAEAAAAAARAAKAAADEAAAVATTASEDTAQPAAQAAPAPGVQLAAY